MKANIKFVALFSFLICPLLLSCSRFSNKLQNLRYECGGEVDLSFPYYVKVLDSQKRELSTETRGRLQVETTETGSADIIPHRLSSKSCILLPSSKVSISISAENIQESGVAELNLNDDKSVFYLKALAKVEARMKCPDIGYFVNDKLPNMIDFKVDGDAKSLVLKVLAVDSKSLKSFELFKKGKGEDFAFLPEFYDTRGLPDGHYRIDTVLGNNFESWARPRLLDVGGFQCPITVSHQAPGIEYLEAVRGVVPPKTLIPWSTVDSAELKSCFIDDGKSELNCSPPPSCEGVPIQSGFIHAPETSGYYRLLVWAQGKNGLQGMPLCQNIRIASDAPDFAITWRNKEWQDGFASFDMPLTKVEAEITRFDDNVIPASFSCKVDFISSHGIQLSSPDVRCLSESCKDRSLNEFVPCEKSIGMTLVNLWGKQEINESYFRLTVRADDGAGHFRERSRLAFMSENSRDIINLNSEKIDSRPESDNPPTIYPLKDGSLFKLNSPNDQIWNEKDGWKDVLSHMPTESMSKNYILSQGVLWTTEYSKNDQIYRLSQYGNFQLNSRMESKEAIYFGRESSDRGAIVATDRKIYLLLGSEIKFIADFLPINVCPSPPGLYTNGVRAVAVCPRSIYEVTDGNWKEIYELGDGSQAGSLILDEWNFLQLRITQPHSEATEIAIDLNDPTMIKGLFTHITEMLSKYDFLKRDEGGLKGELKTSNGHRIYKRPNGLIFLESDPPLIFGKNDWAKFHDVIKAFEEDIYFLTGALGPIRQILRFKKRFQKRISQDFLSNSNINSLHFLPSKTNVIFEFSGHTFRGFAELKDNYLKSQVIPFTDSDDINAVVISQELTSGNILLSDINSIRRFVYTRDDSTLKAVSSEYVVPGLGYEDKEGRIWFACPRTSENFFFPFCKIQDGQTTKINISLAEHEHVKYFLDDGKSFRLFTDKNRIFVDSDRIGKFQEVTQEAFTKGTFQFNVSKCNIFENTKLICVELGADASQEQYFVKRIWHWNADNGMEEIQIPANTNFSLRDGLLMQIDAQDRIVVKFYEGVYRLDDNNWTELFSQKDLSQRLKILNANFFEIKYEKANDRLWYIDSNYDLWLEENVSSRKNH